MKLIEAKIIFDADDIKKTQEEIESVFYEFGAQGLKIEEPLENKNPLDYYRDERQFLMRDYSISSYFPMNFYADRKKRCTEKPLKKNFRIGMMWSIHLIFMSLKRKIIRMLGRNTFIQKK